MYSYKSRSDNTIRIKLKVLLTIMTVITTTAGMTCSTDL